jgi:hypothetical protein
MPVLSVSRTNELLVKHLPQDFVQKYMKDRKNGFLHCKVVADVERGLLKFGPNNFLGDKRPALQWATMLQNITDIEGRAEFNRLFSKYEVSKGSLSPILEGLGKKSVEKVLREADLYNSALNRPVAKLMSFHHLTAALFAYNILKDELGSDAVIAAQAILFHHENNIGLIPHIPVVRLLRDAVKLEDLGKWRMTDCITKNVADKKRYYFNQEIPIDLRIDVVEGRSTPEKQEFEGQGFKLDAFQFALKLLFIDTNPNMFALPKMADPYLRRHKHFNDLLGVVINAAEEQNKNTYLQIYNLDELKISLVLAAGNKIYKRNKDIIEAGMGKVDEHLTDQVLRKIEDSLVLTPFSDSLLSMKALVLEILGRQAESQVIRKLMMTRRGLSINADKPVRLN